MFKYAREYTTWKLKSKLKDKLIQYSEEKNENLKKVDDWKHKIYIEDKCLTSRGWSKEKFEKDREQKIKWFHGQYVVSLAQEKVIKEILDLMEKI